MTLKSKIRLGLIVAGLVAMTILVFRIFKGYRKHFEMCGFSEKWTIFSPDFDTNTYLIPRVYLESKAPEVDYLKVDIHGGIVPMNILTVYSPNDSLEKKVIYYHYDIFENKLDTSKFIITEEYWNLKEDEFGCVSSVELLEGI